MHVAFVVLFYEIWEPEFENIGMIFNLLNFYLNQESSSFLLLLTLDAIMCNYGPLQMCQFDLWIPYLFIIEGMWVKHPHTNRTKVVQEGKDS